jgi:hypothetical protein
MKFSSYPIQGQPSTFLSPMIPSYPVTLNSFAAFADAPVDTRLAGYVAGGPYYNSIAAKYGTDVANQVAVAAANGDRGSMSMILGSAVPLGQPGGGTVAEPLDESMTDALVDQLYNDPLGAPIEQVNKVLTNTGNKIASSSGITGAITLLGVGVLVWFVLAHNK